MTITGAEKWTWNWVVGRAKGYLRRFALLEQRVSDLEARLEKQPADGCPYCGARAMRLKEATPYLKGDPGKQWQEETWKCGECSKELMRAIKLK